MTDSTKATRADIQIGSLKADGFMLPDGSYRLDLNYVTSQVGSFVENFECFLNSRFELLDKWDGYKVEEVICDSSLYQVVPLSLATAFWMYRGFSLKDAQAMRWVCSLVFSDSRNFEDAEKMGARFVDLAEINKSQSKPRQASEKHCVLKLKKQLGGRTEVLTPVGRIDLLTDRQVIEVKSVDLWKAALGQAVAYGSYYPHHGLRLHLFGECDQKRKKAITQCCAKQKVEVSWSNS